MSSQSSWLWDVVENEYYYYDPSGFWVNSRGERIPLNALHSTSGFLVNSRGERVPSNALHAPFGFLVDSRGEQIHLASPGPARIASRASRSQSSGSGSYSTGDAYYTARYTHPAPISSAVDARSSALPQQDVDSLHWLEGFDSLSIGPIAPVGLSIPPSDSAYRHMYASPAREQNPLRQHPGGGTQDSNPPKGGHTSNPRASRAQLSRGRQANQSQGAPGQSSGDPGGRQANQSQGAPGQSSGDPGEDPPDDPSPDPNDDSQEPSVYCPLCSYCDRCISTFREYRGDRICRHGLYVRLSQNHSCSQMLDPVPASSISTDVRQQAYSRSVEHQQDLPSPFPLSYRRQQVEYQARQQQQANYQSFIEQDAQAGRQASLPISSSSSQRQQIQYQAPQQSSARSQPSYNEQQPRYHQNLSSQEIQYQQGPIASSSFSTSSSSQEQQGPSQAPQRFSSRSQTSSEQQQSRLRRQIQPSGLGGLASAYLLSPRSRDLEAQQAARQGHPRAITQTDLFQEEDRMTPSSSQDSWPWIELSRIGRHGQPRQQRGPTKKGPIP